MGATGIAKIGSLLTVLVLLAVTFSVYVLPVLAVHESEVTVIPNITASGKNDQAFTATVLAGEGHDVHEFRVYESGDFDDLICEPKDNWYGPFYGTNQFGEYCQWNAQEGFAIAPDETDSFSFTMDSPDTECCRVMRTEPRDLQQNWVPVMIDICVDKTPPVTTKSFNGPQKIEEGAEWIDGVTTISFEATDCPGGCDRDEGPHDAGIDKILYLNVLAEDFGLGEEPCWNPKEACESVFPSPSTECVVDAQAECEYEPKNPDSVACVENYIDEICFDGEAEFQWKVYTEPIQKKEESCHILQYYSIDGVGNTEEVNANCFFVDKTPPELKKDVGEPEITDEGTGVSYELSTTGDAVAEIAEGGDFGGDIRLQADLIEAYPPSNEGRIYIPVDSFRLKDIYTIMWDAYVTAGYMPHVDVILDFDEDGAGDDALVFEYAKVDSEDCDDAPYPTGSINTFDDKGIVDDDAYAWLGSGPAGPCGDPGFIHGSLADWKAGTVDASVDGDTKVIALEIEVDGWIEKSESYVTSIELNGQDMRILHWVTQGTDITFSCYDQQPHPSEGERVCYKVSFDQDPDGYRTDEYCREYGGTMEGEWCCDAVHETNNKYQFTFMEDSVHDLVYYCEDAVEKRTPTYLQYYRVDDTPPSITKTMIGVDHLGDCPPEGPDDECFVKDSAENGVRIDVADGGDICAVDDVTCSYVVWWMDEPIERGVFGEEGVDIIFTEDSEHTLVVDCKDALGNEMVQDVETFRVDSLPPVTEKKYGEPLVDTEGGYPKWITSDTPITLEAEDAKVGTEETYWRVTLLEGEGEMACWNPYDYCHPLEGGDKFEVYEGPFTIPEDSCHIIEYYSVDKFGNTEETKAQCVFVDNVPPEGIKEVGDPSVEGEGSTGPGESVTIRKEVTTGAVAVADPEIYLLADTTGSMGSAISQVKTDMVSILGSIEARFGAGDYKDFPYDPVYNIYAFMNRQVITDDDTLVTAAINAMSAIGGGDGSEGQFYALQKIAAENAAGFSEDATKIVVWFGDAPAHDAVCSAISGEGSDITEASLISELEDAGIIVIAISTTTGYYDGLDDDPTLSAYDYSSYCTIGGTSGQATRIADATGGVHLTDVSSGDVVDAIIDAIGEVTETTDVVPDASDCVAAGLDVTFDPVKHEDVGAEETVIFDETLELADGVLPGTEIICSIRFRSGALGGIIATENVYVNSDEEPESPPEGSGSVEPEIVEVDLGGDGTIGPDWYVTMQTPIRLSCDDSWDDTVPHPVGEKTIYWRFSNWKDGFEGEPTYSEWFSEVYEGEPIEVNFPEDCWHDLEFYCEDALENSGRTDLEYFIVDTEPPVIEKTMNGPWEGDCPPGEGDICFVDTETSITVDAYDPQPHPVGGVECYYEYVVWDDDELVLESKTMGPYEPPFDVTFPEESEHELTIWCHDALMNVEYDYETFYVDKTPPGIHKDYGRPYFTEEGAEWISSLTPITITVTDDGPHKSGVANTEYRVSLVDDSACWDVEACWVDVSGTGDWNVMDDPLYEEFSIPDESCHLIEITSTDNVGKTSSHKQCVFVDNTAPNPVKEVGEPKTPWDGLDAKFYDLDDFCLEPGKCWRTTILTPIELECVDPDPHPVDHETVCFKVELDAEDATEMYCDEEHYDGVIGDDGFCCLDKELDEPFYFGEVSEHNLAYYCVDALGNKNDVIDDEKFKVEETAFEIELNRKWNLISVPVKLLDDSMDEVFSGVADTVETVWTYDGETGDWYVYTPDGNPGNDDLTTMLPGWGYWVLSNEDDLLVIGGSLMSPAMLPPSKPVVAGWNLIGYYGAEGAPEGDNGYPGYYGPEGNGDPAKCALNTLGVSMWDKGFTSLWTYWEDDNPDLWKALSKLDNMDPGAGYWLLAQEDGTYAPSTTCL